MRLRVVVVVLQRFIIRLERHIELRRLATREYLTIQLMQHCVVLVQIICLLEYYKSWLDTPGINMLLSLTQ